MVGGSDRRRDEDPAATKSRRIRNRLVLAIVLVFLGLFATATIYVVGLLRMQPGKLGPYTDEARQRLDEAWADVSDQPNRWDEFLALVVEEIGGLHRQMQKEHPPVARGAVDWSSLYQDAEQFLGQSDPYDDELRRYEESRRLTRLALDRLRADAALERLEALLATAPRLQRTGWSWQGPMWETLLPELGPSRQTARYLRAEMRLSADEDFERSYRAGTTMLRLGGVIMRQGCTIDALVGIAVQHLAMAELARITPRMNDRQLDEVRTLLEIERRRLDDVLPLIIDMDRLATLQLVQCSYTDNGRGDGRFVPLGASVHADFAIPAAGAGAASRWANLASPAFIRKRPLVAFIDDVHARVQQARLLPFADALDAINAIPTEPATIRRVPLPLLSAWDKIFQSFVSARTTNELLQTLCAVRQHELAYGELPRDLAALTQRFLGEIPEDRFDPAGNHLRYALDPRAPGGFVLYSVNHDGADDGGSTDAWRGGSYARQSTDLRIWPPQEDE